MNIRYFLHKVLCANNSYEKYFSLDKILSISYHDLMRFSQDCFNFNIFLRFQQDIGKISARSCQDFHW